MSFPLSKETDHQQPECRNTDGSPQKPPKPSLHITIPIQRHQNRTLHPPAPSVNSQPTTVNSNAATKASSQSLSESPITFRDINWNQGKNSPASGISEHSPLSDTMSRVPYVSPTGGTGIRGSDGRGLYGVEARERGRGKVVKWLEGMRAVDEGKIGRWVAEKSWRSAP